MADKNEVAIGQAKQSLRKEALEKRKAIAGKADKSMVIASQVIALINERKYTKVGLYMAMNDEVQTTEMIDFCFNQGINIAVPKVEGGIIQFYWIGNYRDVEEGHFNVLEPTTNKIATDFDALIIPMVAFDASGNRLGYGKGYYDRYLSQYQGDQIGVAFEGQRFSTIPTDAYDQRLRLIVSEARCYSMDASQ